MGSTTSIFAGWSGPECRSISADDQRLQGASRTDDAGWVYLHLEGTPDRIGFQHGYLGAPEIEDAVATFRQYVPQGAHRDWGFFRKTAEELFWP